jgi:ComF family protein
MISFSLYEAVRNFSQLLFPHTCAACGNNNLPASSGICSRCISQLPETGFLQQPGNAVEKIFWGRLRIANAAACCFFNKKSAVQQALHQIKYNYRKDACIQLGQWMGHQLTSCGWLQEINVLLPMPLHKKRMLQRGYNQAALLCEGISSVTGTPVLPDALMRLAVTSSQTKQHRSGRWENMQKVFAVKDQQSLIHKHVLLIDDVITTGATLEATGEQLLKLSGLQLSICCFAYTLPYS